MRDANVFRSMFPSLQSALSLVGQGTERALQNDRDRRSSPSAQFTHPPFSRENDSIPIRSFERAEWMSWCKNRLGTGSNGTIEKKNGKERRRRTRIIRTMIIRNEKKCKLWSLWWVGKRERIITRNDGPFSFQCRLALITLFTSPYLSLALTDQKTAEKRETLALSH